MKRAPYGNDLLVECARAGWLAQDQPNPCCWRRLRGFRFGRAGDKRLLAWLTFDACADPLRFPHNAPTPRRRISHRFACCSAALEVPERLIGQEQRARHAGGPTSAWQCSHSPLQCWKMPRCLLPSWSNRLPSFARSLARLFTDPCHAARCWVAPCRPRDRFFRLGRFFVERLSLSKNKKCV